MVISIPEPIAAKNFELVREIVVGKIFWISFDVFLTY